MTATPERRLAQIALNAVSPYVVGIFTKYASDDVSWTFATGVLIEFKGLRLILTAGHVLSIPDVEGFKPVTEFRFSKPPRGGFPIRSNGVEQFWSPVPRSDDFHWVADMDSDLGAVFVSDLSAIQCFPLPAVSAPPLVGSDVFFCGYPRAGSVALQSGADVGDGALPNFQCATVLDPAALPALKSHQFAIDYPNIDGIVTPAGFSGSMVWFDSIGRRRTLDELGMGFTASAAGIVTDHLVAEQALVCTRVEKVAEFIQRLLLIAKTPGTVSQNMT